MQLGASYQTLSRAALGLDQLRTRVLLFSARTRALRPLVVDKNWRIAALGSGHALLALAGALLCPSLLLVLGPLLLGVPHVASDVRYLVLRRSTARGFAGAVLVFSLLLVLLRLLETTRLGDERFATLELSVVSIWLISNVVFFRPRSTSQTRRGLTRRLAVLLAVVALGLFALRQPTLARVVFAHAHNVIGILIWYVLFRRHGAPGWLPLMTIGAGVGLLVFAGGGAPERYGAPEWFDLHIGAASVWLAPGVSEVHQRGLVLSYAFLQAVHYAVWLVFVPLDAHRGQGSPSFTSSLRSAWLDFGPWGLMAIASLALGVIAAACFDPLSTSAVYLFLTPFHGYLELAVLAHWLSNRERA